VAIDGDVYDVTDFLPSHPGGQKIIVNAAGADVSDLFHAFHNDKVLAQVAVPYRIGILSNDGCSTGDSKRAALEEMIPQGDGLGTNLVAGSMWTADNGIQRCTPAEVENIANVNQFEAEALRRLPPALGAGFIGYGSEDNMSLDANIQGYQRYTLRPRVLRDVSKMSAGTSILGGRVNLRFPVVVAPFTNAKAAHPVGELAVGAAVASAGIAYAVPHYCNYPLPEVQAVLAGGAGGGSEGGNSGGFLFQMYPVKKQSASDKESMLGASGIVKSAEDGGLDREYMAGVMRYISSMGCKGLLLTVDTANNANRERTYKNPQWVKAMSEQCGGLPEPRALEEADWIRRASGHTAALTWEDVRWVVDIDLTPKHRANTVCCIYAQTPFVRWVVETVRSEHLGMGVVLKGVMTAEDTAMAAGVGVDGVLVSNHGGRQLDGTAGTIECLEECVQAAADAGGGMEVGTML
jgi:isopentenyl diphosphate isomerase/L-lactate dehydrogenase-like FMN-dependent dehydrogenase